MKISASIVIYNEKVETLEKVINSFLSLFDDKELIIIDNSSDDYIRNFCESFDNVNYIFSVKNIGFGSAHNLAFKKLNIKSDIHMILNPDIYFDGMSIYNFLKWFYNQKDISLATTKVCYPNGSTQNIIRNVPTISSLIKRKLKICSDELNTKKNEITEIPFAHGCFLVFKTEVFEKINCFDERFFMYMEDIDIFIKAKKHGKTVINTNYKIFHEYRKGSSKNFTLLRHHVISAIKFFYKYRNVNLHKFNQI